MLPSRKDIKNATRACEKGKEKKEEAEKRISCLRPYEVEETRENLSDYELQILKLIKKDQGLIFTVGNHCDHRYHVNNGAPVARTEGPPSGAP